MSHSKRPVPVDENSDGPKIRERLHETKEILETGGVDLPGVGGFLYIWKKLGLKGALLAMLLVGFPIGRYSLLRSAVYSGIPRMVGGFGLEFKAEEWSPALFSLEATARNVEMRVPSDDKPVFTAGEIRFGDRPTSFKVNGRSADGVFEISGNAAVFRSLDTPEPKSDYGLKTASFDREASSAAGDYPFEMSVYLEYISAGAYGKMVPVTTIIPVKGLIGGTVKVVRTSAKTECAGSLMMKDVSFAPNPLMLTKASDFDVVQRSLVNVAYSGAFDLCNGTNSEPEPKGSVVPPASLALTRLTEHRRQRRRLPV
jgi:hypothetical protein